MLSVKVSAWKRKLESGDTGWAGRHAGFQANRVACEEGLEMKSNPQGKMSKLARFTIEAID